MYKHNAQIWWSKYTKTKILIGWYSNNNINNINVIDRWGKDKITKKVMSLARSIGKAWGS